MTDSISSFDGSMYKQSLNNQIINGTLDALHTSEVSNGTGASSGTTGSSYTSNGNDTTWGNDNSNPSAAVKTSTGGNSPESMYNSVINGTLNTMNASANSNNAMSSEYNFQKSVLSAAYPESGLGAVVSTTT